MKMNLDYLIDMGRTFRRDDDHKSYGVDRSEKSKKNKTRKQKKNFSGETNSDRRYRNYDIAETYEDHYGDQGFEKFNYAKRKSK